MNRRTLTLCACCFLMHAVRAQTLDSTISQYSSRYAQEKIHIHFDKDAYLPGETVWMKAYLFSGSKPSNISKTIYFDWTDAAGHLLLHSIAPVSEGAAESSFIIPAEVPNGVVHVKAYTQWMLNFEDDFLYNRDIPVLIPSNEFNAEPEKIKPELSFFAEGGDLVNGVSSVLAFETLDQHGRPVNVRGVVVNSRNEVLDSFRTSFRGLGSFQIRPVSGETYTARWADEKGERYSTPLPEVKPNGIVLHLASYNNNELKCTIDRSVDAVTLNHLTVMGTIAQQVVYKSNFTLNNLHGDIAIPTAAFPTGIMQLTVFDGDMSPIAERVVFINNKKYQGTAQLKKDMVSLDKRSRNEISIEIPDSLSTNLSVSVTDAGLGTDGGYNIYSDLLLSGDLKGNVSDAAYFLDSDPSSADHLNLLLMTHGWRRFNWEAVVSGKLPNLKYLHDVDFLSLKGQIRGNAGAFSESDSIGMVLIAKDRKKQVLNLPLTADGKFNQHGLYFYDSVQIAYKFNHVDKINSGTSVNLYSGLLPALTPAHAMEPGYAWMKVPDVILEKEMNGNIIETNNYAIPSDAMSYILTPGSDGRRGNSETVAHYLSTMFADLRFPASLKEKNAEHSDISLTAYSPNGAPAGRANVNIAIDGSPVAMDDLKDMSMREVLFIKFVAKTTLKGLPTLAISSRQSAQQADILENKTGLAVVTGYTPVREFYAPKYSDKITDYAASDFRSTLYWNSDLHLDKTHRKVKLTFYNNDVTNKFRIVVEGMNQEGKLTRIEEIIK
ncbi:MAG TPA: hypothetical protein VG890_17835 [Puia sp.]|nr:hypothetical protein [Puia sp.]